MTKSEFNQALLSYFFEMERTDLHRMASDHLISRAERLQILRDRINYALTIKLEN